MDKTTTQSTTETPDDLLTHAGQELRNAEKNKTFGILDAVDGDRVAFRQPDDSITYQSRDTVEMKIRTGAMAFTAPTFTPEAGN